MIPKNSQHSPSSLNLFCANLPMFVLERIIGERQPVGAPAHRGTAVEEGVAFGLRYPTASEDECTEIALRKYDTLMALNTDKRRQDYRLTIRSMIRHALAELRPYGHPTGIQGIVEWKPDGLKYPIVGFYDFAWQDHGIVVDLKTTDKMPSAIKLPHARQVALYAARSDNMDARLTYVTPTKKTTYRLENVREHLAALHQIAMRCEKFLSLSDDPEFFVSITAPDFESFYWTGSAARQIGFERWGF